MKNILPHSPLKKLADDLWIVEGTLPYGNPLPRNMIIFRTAERKLWIHSPVALNENTLTEVKNLGEISWIVVPNGMHRMDAETWKDEFPEAKVVCPRAAREKVEDKVQVDTSCEEEFIDGCILAMAVAGSTRNELAYELKLKDGRKALIMNDLIVNIGSLPGFLGKIFKVTGRIGKFRVPKPQEFLFLFNKVLFKNWLKRMSAKGYSIVAISHGKPATRNVTQYLITAANRM